MQDGTNDYNFFSASHMCMTIRLVRWLSQSHGVSYYATVKHFTSLVDAVDPD